MSDEISPPCSSFHSATFRAVIVVEAIEEKHGLPLIEVIFSICYNKSSKALFGSF